MKTYEDHDGRRRCLECDGYVAARARRCTRCANRQADAEQRQADELVAAETARAKAEASAKASRWRHNRLRRYVSRVLATKSGSTERQRFFESNPLSGIFN